MAKSRLEQKANLSKLIWNLQEQIAKTKNLFMKEKKKHYG